MIKIIFIIFLCLLNINIDKCNAKSKNEDKYVPKVIVEGKWGDGEDEYHQAYKHMPINSPIEFKPVYRYSFDIDNNDNIYVLAGLKLLKYNSSGNWEKTLKGEPPAFGYDIRIASDDNIFVLFAPWQQRENILQPEDYTCAGIRVFDNSLNSKGTYKIKIKNNSAYSLYKDEYGNIWYEDKVNRYPFYIDGRIYEKGEQISSPLKDKWLSKDKKYRYRFAPRNDYLDVLDNKDKIVKKLMIKTDFPIDINGKKEFLSFDKKDNFYLGFNDHLYKNHEVCKYDKKGNTMTSIKMKSPSFKRKLDYSPTRPIAIDGDGNIYQLYVSDDEGVQIIKWEKKN